MTDKASVFAFDRVPTTGNPLQLLTEVFGASEWPSHKLQELHRELNAWHWQHQDCGSLQPCVIQQKPALICASGLSRQQPTGFEQLQALCQRYGIQLKEDSRQQDAGYQGTNRRRNVGMALGFCLGILAHTRSFGSERSEVGTHLIGNGTYQAAHVVHLGSATTIPDAHQLAHAMQQKATTIKTDIRASQRIRQFLLERYEAHPGDPDYVQQDLNSIADYYAQFPAVIDLIDVLEQQRIRLHYRQDLWQTEAIGDSLRIDHIVVSFDTHLAAQFLSGRDCADNPACYLSPADALLHELLHAKLMLAEPQSILAHHATHLYPYQHEHDVIQQENSLYQSMNARDSAARPIRTQHSGILLRVECALCRTPSANIQAWLSQLTP